MRDFEVLVEDEVAQTVGNELALIELKSLNNVRMVPDHQIGSGVNRGARCFFEEFGTNVGELVAAVKLNNDDVGACAPGRNDCVGDRRP